VWYCQDPYSQSSVALLNGQVKFCQGKYDIWHTCPADNLEKEPIYWIPGTKKTFVLCFSIKYQVRLEETLKEVKKHLAPERKVFAFLIILIRSLPSVCSHVCSLFV